MQLPSKSAYEAATAEIIAASHWIYAQGWAPATAGNYSVRLDEERIAITVSGQDKSSLDASGVMLVNDRGIALQSNCKPSAETLLHTVVYAQLPMVGAVLHTHSVQATVWSRVQRGSVWKLHGYEVQKALPEIDSHETTLAIPIFENTQDIPLLANQVRAVLQEHPDTPAFLIRGHGMYTWGQHMALARQHLEALEFLLACELGLQRSKR